jgi:hypothetical protein
VMLEAIFFNQHSVFTLPQYTAIFPSQNYIFAVGINKMSNGFTLNNSAVPDNIDIYI